MESLVLEGDHTSAEGIERLTKRDTKGELKDMLLTVKASPEMKETKNISVDILIDKAKDSTIMTITSQLRHEFGTKFRRSPMFDSYFSNLG